MHMVYIGVHAYATYGVALPLLLKENNSRGMGGGTFQMTLPPVGLAFNRYMPIYIYVYILRNGLASSPPTHKNTHD